MKNGTSARRFRPGYFLGIVTAMGFAAMVGAIARPPAALAQIPDAGAQRIQMLREQQTTNQKLTEVVALLREIRDFQAAASGAKPAKKTRPPVRRP
jgi:hypothetical protein